MKRRKNFHGNIDEYQTEDGPRFRVRARIDGELKTLESGLLSYAAAEEFCRGYVALRSKREVYSGMTLVQFGDGFFERREARGVRGVRRERNRWKNHIEGRSIGQIPIRSLQRSDVVTWRDELVSAGLRRGTQDLCLTLVRSALGDALDRDLVTSNVAADVKSVRDRQDVAKEELDGVLLPDEQVHLLDNAPDLRALRIAGLALLTGIRLSELRELRWEDVYMGRRGNYLMIRRSEGGLAPKNGKARRVELLAPAVEILNSIERVSPWVVTGKRGGQVAADKAPCGVTTWRKWRRATGLEIRWHDLRHTCATSLLAGWWGRKWGIEAVSKQLGHSSIQVTEIYARKVDDLTRDEVRGMFHESAIEREVEIVNSAVFTGANYQIRTGDLRVTNARALPRKSDGYANKSVTGDTHKSAARLPGRKRGHSSRPDDHLGSESFAVSPRQMLAEAAWRMGVLPDSLARTGGAS